MEAYQFTTVVENGMIKVPSHYTGLNSQSVKVIVLIGEEKTNILPSFVKPLRKTVSVEALKKEQNYTGFDTKAFDLLCREFESSFTDEDESLEELLAML